MLFLDAWRWNAWLSPTQMTDLGLLAYNETNYHLFETNNVL